jgi:protein-disulfide isomerase
MAVRTAAGRAVAVAAGAALLVLSVAACNPVDSVTTSSGAEGSASPGPSVSPSGGTAEAGTALLASLPARLEADGTTITVGDPAAKNSVHVYEDPRCPICKHFEAANGATLALLAESGKAKVQYTLASFLDGNLGGGGSKRAANALRAALKQGKFPAYHAVLYDNQPNEQQDGFTDAHLLKLAGTVNGLRGAAFDKAVKANTYGAFVTKSEEAFVASGAQGTPTVVINGRMVTSGDVQKLFDAGTFAGLMKAYGIG